MLTFFKGAFGLAAGETAETPVAEKRTADLRDNILDQLVTVVWTLVLVGQEWGRWHLGMAANPYPVSSMGAMALGYATWRLIRLVPRYKEAAG